MRRLEWRQVDVSAGEVRLDPGKTKNGEGRMFPMTRELREMLEQQRAITELLQRQRKGRQPSRKTSPKSTRYTTAPL